MAATDHITIRASAGTGKTFQLSSRYLRLLLSGAHEHEILASTFTRKAAAEILDRVLRRLATACEDDSSCGELASQLELPDLTSARCRRALRSLVNNLHRIRIGTLDSFFAQLAGSYSLELGLPPGWTILDPGDDAQLRDQAIESLLHNGDPGDLQRLFQLLTKGEAERSVSELVRQQINNLYDRFLDAPAAAWQTVPRPAPLSKEDLAATITDLTDADLPANKNWQKAVDKDIALAIAADWETLLSKGIAACILAGKTNYYRLEIPDTVANIYERLIRHGRAILLRTLADQTVATYELLERFANYYEPLKYEQQGLLFDDVTRNLADYLRGTSDGNIDRLTFRLDGRIRHLLLDEFQDTSIAQWDVLQPFATHITSDAKLDPDETVAPSFFCVGDEKQAIYGWRGGVAEVFDAVEQRLAGLNQQHLDVSRRSAPAIIDTVNQIFQGIGKHTSLDQLAPAVHEWQDRFRKHETIHAEMPGYAELSTAARHGDNERPLDATLRHTAGLVADLSRAAAGCTIGVLVRRNAVVAQLIYEIRELGVEAGEQGGNPLIDSPAVQAIVALLRLADHPGDLVVRMHLANSPLDALTGHTSDEAAYDLARKARERVQTFGYGRAIEDWVKPLLPQCVARDQHRLLQLIDAAYSYPAGDMSRTAPFVWYVENTTVSDANAANVQVMTIHQAKGLEFDIVVLPELDTQLKGQADACVVGRDDPVSPIKSVCRYRNETVQSLLPPELQNMFEENSRQRLMEQICNLYVAVTRSIHALYMVIAPSAENERKLHRTYAGLVRAALTDGTPVAPNTTLYQSGDPNWFTSPRLDQTAIDTGTGKESREPSAIRLAPMPRRQRSLEWTSPSRLARHGEHDVAALFDKREQGAMVRGTLIHACFEQLEWLDEGPPDKQTLREALRDLDTAGLSLDQIVADFEEMLRHDEVSRMLRRSFYGPLQLVVSNEHPIAVRHDSGLLTGTIDRLVLQYDGHRLMAADIIDFKTDKVDTGDAIAQKVDDYRPQLESYRKAVSTVYGLSPDKISARLLFVGNDVARDV